MPKKAVELTAKTPVFWPQLTAGVDMICIATDCAKSPETTTLHQLLAQSLSKSSNFMICVPLANHRV